ncbi:hypothetical protein AMTRI_Chr04g189300 [Amborella trichopoda]
MAALMIFEATLLLSLSSVAAQSFASRNIRLGSSLYTTAAGNNFSYWLSPSGNFAFGFYPLSDHQQFIVGIWMPKTPENTLVWSADRDGPPFSLGSSFSLTRNGTLILRNREPQIETISINTTPASLASLLDNGNLVLYNSQSQVIWASFDSPTDTILSGQTLNNGFKLSSSAPEINYSTEGARTTITNDDAYWVSDGTWIKGANVTLNLAQMGICIWSIYRAKLEVGGNFRLFSHSLDNNAVSVIWSALEDPCKAHGLYDMDPTCKCPPGFSYMDPYDSFQGCEKIFTEEECKGNGGIQRCEMIEMKNIEWLNNAYVTLSGSEEDCKQDCLDDRYCIGILFQDHSCEKHSESIIVKACIKVDKKPSNKRKGAKHKILLLIGLALIAFCVILVWQALPKDFEPGKIGPNEVNLRSFSYSELKKATQKFATEFGDGAFGTVYFGSFPCNTKVAVKKLKKKPRTHCNQGSHRLLIYEFMENGSLADLLFKTESRPSWAQRVGITLDIARGLLYLHEECISDFGLAKFLKPDQTSTFTGIRGTRGYVAPEWHKHQAIKVRADVYSFGIMLIKIICYRKAVETGAPENEIALTDWVYECFKTGELEKLERLAD